MSEAGSTRALTLEANDGSPGSDACIYTIKRNFVSVCLGWCFNSSETTGRTSKLYNNFGSIGDATTDLFLSLLSLLFLFPARLQLALYDVKMVEST